jgi:hypothetical protein
MNLTERVYRCRYCHREMDVGGLAHRENPFCSVCLTERALKARGRVGAGDWVVEDNYFAFIPRRACFMSISRTSTA